MKPLADVELEQLLAPPAPATRSGPVKLNPAESLLMMMAAVQALMPPLAHDSFQVISGT